MPQTPAPDRAGTRPHLFPLGLILLALLAAVPALASGHREAPAILDMPEVDAADFYMFRSYEPGRAGFVTFIADYNPMQDPFGAPNYYPLRDGAFYDIRIDNTGAAVENLTFRFRFSNRLPVVVPATPGLGVFVPLPNGTFVPVGIPNVFPFGPGAPPPPPGGALNAIRTFTVRVIRGPVSNPTSIDFLSNAADGSHRFATPFDDIGSKSIPQYDAYAAQFIYQVAIPGCSGTGQLFVGPRKDPFAMNLGEFFDAVNIPNPIGPRAAEVSSLANKNVTSIVLEVPISCLGAGSSGVIGAWTSAHLRTSRDLVDNPTFDVPFVESGGYTQVSRQANPLVNTMEIGVFQKNLFNASRPKDDAQFLLYFQKPTVPVGIQIVTGLTPPTNLPRTDLVALYTKGLPGINQDNSGGEVLRLNTSTAPQPAAQQNNLGLLGGDLAGWPNGRRPGDDVVDITLRMLEGALCYQNLGLCTPADAPNGQLPFTDQAWVEAAQFPAAFPYLNSPIAASPNRARIFNAFLAGGTAATGTCTGLLTAAQDDFSITCTHNLPGASVAELVQGSVVICSFGSVTSPIQSICAMTPQQVDALQKQRLAVIIAAPAAVISGAVQ
ncbi:MAG TPA: DUF4331 domain-containing protein [Thermoanaerobaculia bacterium]|nr:DUF4331 domain-containing protein [Thermoanaerobaculia bacterium]